MGGGGGEGISALFQHSSMDRGGRGHLAPVTSTSPVRPNVAAVGTGTNAPPCSADGATEQGQATQPLEEGRPFWGSA